MSGKTTKIALGEESDGSLTDWVRLRAMDDEEIDAAIASDPDSYPLTDHDLEHSERAYRYQLLTIGGIWRWRLIGRSGEVLADSPTSYPNEQAALKAIRLVRGALMTGKIAA